MNGLRARASSTAKCDARLGSSLSPVTESHIRLCRAYGVEVDVVGADLQVGCVGFR